MADQCTRCGTELVGRLQDQCPRCLLAAALGSGPEPQEPLEGEGGELELLTPGRTLVGRYTVLERVGEGGMSVVLAAYDSRLDRRVALKLLRPRGDTYVAELRARLVREAQAMARLSHPQVVQVYDAGTLEEGSLFIAMEYVQGQTLRSWCEAQPRSWREVLEAWLAAGRGLAAAHEAGLIHRDFKPDNVLVGADGRVRVTDFGLVRAELSPEPTPPAPELPPPEAWGGVLTWPGSLLGTPRYMAPELLEGQPADVRSDLYAWCVSLYEALYGRLPFTGGVLDRKVEPPPADSKVPPWVTRLVLQGLEAAPQRRPASMAALLEALSQDPERRRRARLQAAALACAGALLVGLGVGVWNYIGGDCNSLGNRLAGVWDGGVRERVEQAMLGTELPYAQDTAERLSKVLDEYARTWVAMRTHVCEQARAQGGLPQSLNALQEHCLERRLNQLKSLTELLQGSDRASLPRAVQAAQSLPPLLDCTDEQVLKAGVPLPEDPALREKVEQLQQQVDKVEAHLWTGKYKEGLELDKALWPQVEQVVYVPLQARARYWGARMREGLGAYLEAEQMTLQALDLAARAGDRTLQARTWTLLAVLLGERLARLEEKEVLLLDKVLEHQAEAAADNPTHIGSLTIRGAMFHRLKQYAQARDRYERAVALAQEALGPAHPLLISSLQDLASVLKELGEYEEARQAYERALKLGQESLGPEHPLMIGLYINLGSVLKDQARYEEALQRFEQGLELQRRLQGARHPHVMASHNNLAMLLEAMGRYEEAQEHYQYALALTEELLGLEHPHRATVLLNLCGVLHELDRYKEALARCESARALGEKKQAAGQFEVAYALSLQGRILHRLGRPEEARQSLERARELMEKAMGPKHPFMAHPLVGLGDFLRTQGQPAQAVPVLERALALGLEDGLGELQFALAQALWDSGRDRARARELATQALEYYRPLKHPKQAQVAQWLAEHGQP